MVAEVQARDRTCRFPHGEVPGLGCAGQLDCHEIIPRSAWAGGWLVPANVILVCRWSHEWIGAYPDAAQALGFHGYSWDRP